MNASLLPRDTVSALALLPVKDCSRSLYFDRYARPDLSKESRRNFFMSGLTAHRHSAKAHDWSMIADRIGGRPLYAQLQSRLMVNMAGGVMENAGLCLDRFGLPYIPGTAVKGCARRAALAALREWCESGQKPGSVGGDRDNVFTGACKDFGSPADMLVAIARIFGWSEEDWKAREEILRGVRPKNGEDDAQFERRCQKLWEEKRSDFAWACGSEQVSIFKSAAETLSKAFQWPIPPERQRDPWRALPSFAGSISFMPAYPVDLNKTGKVDGLPIEVPQLGELELDVVTVHHKNYYADKDPGAVATDTEEPVPNVFSAVASGHVFAFVVAKLQKSADIGLATAQAWLACGLSAFGLGAKTAAGYGWFACGEGVQTIVVQELEKRRQREAEKRRKEEEEARQKESAEAARRKKEDEKATMATLTPEQQEDYKLAQLSGDQFRSALDNFAKKGSQEQKAIVRASRLPADSPGSRRTFWEDLKAKAQKKGGKAAQTEQAIRQLSKQMYQGKEGKMP